MQRKEQERIAMSAAIVGWDNTRFARIDAHCVRIGLLGRINEIGDGEALHAKHEVMTQQKRYSGYLR